jgi:hypothetical protein
MLRSLGEGGCMRPTSKKLLDGIHKLGSCLFSEKWFPEVVKNLKMSYYLLIISNVVLKLLIANF